MYLNLLHNHLCRSSTYVFLSCGACTGIVSFLTLSDFSILLLLTSTLQFLSSKENFQQFLSSHLDMFNSHPNSEDVIQLALNEEENGDIYRQAVIAARSHDQQSFWLIWK